MTLKLAGPLLVGHGAIKIVADHHSRIAIVLGIDFAAGVGGGEGVGGGPGAGDL